MMNRSQFVEYIIDNMKIIVDKKYTFKEEKVLKNNGVILSAICIREEGSNVSAVVYVEPLYNAYISGSTVPQIVDKIKAQIEGNLSERNFDSSMQFDWEYVKKHVVVQLINYEKNQQFLESVPHKRYLDFAVIFRCYIGQEDDKVIMSILHDCSLEAWGVSVEELYKIALGNSVELLSASVGRLESMLLGWGVDDEVESMRDVLTCLYVLSNQYGVSGAAVLLYPEELQKLADRLQNDLIILPSSIHEVLAVEYDDEADLAEYQNMVRTVNREHVPEEDFLSNSVYVYRRETKSLEIAESAMEMENELK